MKKLLNAFRYTTGSLVILLGLVFAVLEATLLVTFDFMLYQSRLIAALQIILRLALALGSLVVGILSFVKKSRAFWLEGACITVACCVAVFFMSNGIGLILVGVSALFTSFEVLFYKANKLDAK